MAQHCFKLIIATGWIAAALTAGLSGGACAFTETTITPAQPQAAEAAPGAQLHLQKPESGNGFQFTTPGDGKSGGTELSIPGIGSVGTLPKLDFGLDLLYGAGSDPVQERPQENENKDVTIKGTIRHRF